MNDDMLHEAARQVGARAAERLDVDATARAVLRRLREASEALPVWWAQPAWLRAAATVVLLLGGFALARNVAPPPREPSRSVAYVGEDLTTFSSDQLLDVLQEIGQTGGSLAPSSLQEAGLEDLTAAQLQELLRSLEG
jgi:hypothetical protein